MPLRHGRCNAPPAQHQRECACAKAGQICPTEPYAGRGSDMKHPSSREFFAYWDGKRGDARAPDRSEIEPGAVRDLLGDIFVLPYDSDAGYPFRVAGTRISALLGRDLKDHSFSGLFAPESRDEIEDLIGHVAEEMLAAVAGITAASANGSIAHLELLLLPFCAR